ncbi:nucleotidyltransferase [Bremerella sp. JC817]|uniref:nucleotidyltransferase n=1 Tax=Bremerella sp. JC817 TaxID=3231756 RepID=UPI003458D414
MHMVMKEELSDFLRAVADDLDIPGHLYEDAVVKYTDVGEWLAQEDSELAQFDPDIFPQGSFRLGTMVRPINDSEEYDIDLVCHLKIRKENTTQKELKDRVGKRLKARDDIKEILIESRRCWVLDYPEPFHMDVLPVIPNVEQPPNGILLTDTELRLWQFSNPIDYAEWFKEQMKVVLMEKRAAYAKRYQMSIEEVPEYEVKTPLQRVVQILKRHRDIYFKDDLQNRPISIIITTLAAKAYANQPDLYEALVSVATRMHEHIEKRDNGEWWVENPVEEGENFAHKWNEYPERREAFFNWLEKVRDDFVSASQTESLTKTAAALSPALGRNVVSRAAASLGVPQSGLITKSATISTPQVPALASSSHCVPPVWPISLQYQVNIKGTVHPGSPRSKAKWAMTQRPVPRNVWLRFEAKTNVPEPYEVRWQVVNTGQDAIVANGLRGDEFEESNGANKHIRWEGTEYRGTHWIETFIIRHGVCVARSQPFKVRIRG